MRRTKEQKTNRGITLIALVITIIVMLILVAVTITMAVNGGLFDYAGKAVSETRNAINEEQELGKLEVNMTVDELIDQYTGTEEGGQLPTYAEASFQDGYLTENASFTSGGYTAIIPKGFKISEEEGEGTITTGLVIKDAKNNEFVWIPVTTSLENTYSYETGYSEPATVAADEGKSYDFTSEYNAMVTSVNNNDGFYIGRYETTNSASSEKGSRYGENVFTADNWYDLYEAQKSANVEGNGTNVQTAMVYGVLWDEMIAFISQKDLSYDVHTKPSDATLYWNDNSTISQAGLAGVNDKALNIYELASNRPEWTQESFSGVCRVLRGSDTSPYGGSRGASFRGAYVNVGIEYYSPDFYTNSSYTFYGLASRMVMYIL